MNNQAGKGVISVPDKHELGPNAKNPETWPGKVPLKDDSAARRSKIGPAAGNLAIRGTVKDQKKGK
jgi:hypothetical protein